MISFPLFQTVRYSAEVDPFPLESHYGSPSAGSLLAGPEPIPAEAEANYYAANETLDMVA